MAEGGGAPEAGPPPPFGKEIRCWVAGRVGSGRDCEGPRTHGSVWGRRPIEWRDPISTGWRREMRIPNGGGGSWGGWNDQQMGGAGGWAVSGDGMDSVACVSGLRFVTENP